MADDILIDGTRLAWAEFVDTLTTLRDAFTIQPGVGHVRAPRHCHSQAARLIADLDLSDCITVLDEPPARTERRGALVHPAGPLWSAPQERVRIPAPAAERALLGALRPRFLHD